MSTDPTSAPPAGSLAGTPAGTSAAHPFARLLLATERSDYDRPAERTALAMAQRCGLPLQVVLPLRSNPEYELAAPELALREEQAVGERVRALRAEAAQSGVTLELVLRRGEEPWREIVAEAVASGADLVVTRQRGRQGVLARLLVGEMVSKVAGHVPCSVLMVPPPGGLWSRHVLAAVDASAHAPLVAARAAAVAAVCGLPLTLLSVAGDTGPAAQAAAQALLQHAAAAAAQAAPDLPQPPALRVATGRPYEAIVQVAEQIGADLIVVGRRGETALADLADLPMGSTAQRVVGLSQRAVLLVRA